MVSTTNLIKAHGLTYAKIIDVWAIIRSDADNVRHKFVQSNSAASANRSRIDWTPTNIELFRETDGDFDTVDFDSTSYNRGWIFIQFID